MDATTEILKKQLMVGQFVNAVGCSQDEAKQILTSSRWQFEVALSIFFQGHSVAGNMTRSNPQPVQHHNTLTPNTNPGSSAGSSLGSRMSYALTNEVNTEEASLLDSSLTSLSWLQNLRVHDLISSSALVSPLPDECTSSPSPYPEGNGESYGISLSPIKKCLVQSADFKKHPRKYYNSSEKPPFSYSTLLYLAIQQSKTGKVTLNEIYRWIKERFKYYRCAEAGWQNSIRHNLSLNELFFKVPRSHGKGNHWRINPNYQDLLENNKDYLYLDQRHSSGSSLRSSKLKGNCGRKRAHSQSESSFQDRSSRGLKRRRTGTSPADLYGMQGELDWISLLGSQRMSSSHNKPIFGSPDLPHVTEPALSSPLVFPVTTAAIPAELPATPSVIESHGSLLEDVVLKQDSPSPQVLLPWAEKNSQSPGSTVNLHPWAESKESTMHGLKKLYRRAKSLGGGPPIPHPIWSPDHNWSSSTSALSVGAHQVRTPMISGTN